MPLRPFVPPEIEKNLFFYAFQIHISLTVQNTHNPPFPPLPLAQNSVLFCYSANRATWTLVAIKPLSGDGESFRAIKEKEWNE